MEDILPIGINYLTKENGCRIVVCGKSGAREERVKARTYSTMHPNSIITSGHLPQSVTLELATLKYKPASFNHFGFENLNVNPANPKIIEISASSNGKDFESLGLYNCRNKKGWQAVQFQDIAYSDVRFFKISVVENYGAEETEFYQMFLGQTEAEQQSSTSQKDFQQDHRRQNTEKASLEEIVRMMESRICSLEQQNRTMRDQAKQQTGLLTQLQQTVGILVRNLDLVKGIIQQNSNNPSSAAATFYSLPESPNKLKHLVPLDILEQVEEYPEKAHINKFQKQNEYGSYTRNTHQHNNHKYEHKVIRNKMTCPTMNYGDDSDVDQRFEPQQKTSDVKTLLSELKQKLNMRDKLQQKLIEQSNSKRSSSKRHTHAYF